MIINRRNLLLASGALAAGGAYIVGFPEKAEVKPAFAQDLSTLFDPPKMGENKLGSDDAPVKVVEYASMTCPYCAIFHIKTLPQFKKDYIDTGKVQLYLREFPFDPRSTAAFMLSKCVGPKRYFAMVDLLFQQQDVWATASNPEPELLRLSRLAGLSEEDFYSCLKNQELLDNINEVRVKGADTYGVQSTPSFFINGKIHTGALSYKELTEIIDPLL